MRQSQLWMASLPRWIQMGITAAYVLLLTALVTRALWIQAFVVLGLLWALRYLRLKLAKAYRLSFRALVLIQTGVLVVCVFLLMLQSDDRTSGVELAQQPSAGSALRRPLPSAARSSNPVNIPRPRVTEHVKLALSLTSSVSSIDHPDLRQRTSEQIRAYYPILFRELPAQFDATYKNPCWANADPRDLQCLPYAYLLGMPKCGSSDLWERLSSHPEVASASRKEIRWFTRGEFADDDNFSAKWSRDESLSTFTKHLTKAVGRIREDPQTIVIDGGPHTLWWPTQSPSGKATDDIPAAQLLHEMQPDAKFLITLRDPVHRLYSDYYFLNDDKSVARNGRGKSPEAFHQRMVSQIDEMKQCIAEHSARVGWFQASQICAHDRHKFGRAGWGRLNIGMYMTFMAKWIPLFKREQFLILRLEDFDKDRQKQLQTIFEFLGLRDLSPSEWGRVLPEGHRNELKFKKEPMLAETEQLLRAFYAPYNSLLAEFMQNDAFLWAPLPKDTYDDENDEASEQVEQVADTNAHLRGASEFSLKPKAFDISKLPGPIKLREDWNDMAKTIDSAAGFRSASEAGDMLCSAAVSLELGAIKYLLYDVGLPVNSVKAASQRTPLHCLAINWLLTDSFPTSFTFNQLQGKPSWLFEMLEPQLPKQTPNVYAKSIIDSMQAPIGRMAQWLIAAGVDLDRKDKYGYTALMIASQGGLESLVSILLERGADPNISGPNNITPLHFAAVFGHVNIAKMLVDAGANRNAAHYFKISFDDILKTPGAISAADAKSIFNVVQRPPKTLSPPQGRHDGGWDTKRLNRPAISTKCDIDMLDATDAVQIDLWREYTAQNKPVLIRGLIDDWPAMEEFSRDVLLEKYGDLVVQVSGIPYAHKFDPDKSHSGTEMRIDEYMEQMSSHTVVGGEHPWYIFKPFRIPTLSEQAKSPVSQAIVPVPRMILNLLSKVQKYTSRRAKRDEAGLEGHSRAFVNAQWAIGSPGTGAPVHYHNTAWNALVYGAKQWLIYPPAHKIMSNDQILAFIEGELPRKQDMKPMTCVQEAGDVMIVPESWAHGVLNLQDSVAVATELRDNLLRVPDGASTVRAKVSSSRKKGIFY